MERAYNYDYHIRADGCLKSKGKILSSNSIFFFIFIRFHQGFYRTLPFIDINLLTRNTELQKTMHVFRIKSISNGLKIITNHRNTEVCHHSRLHSKLINVSAIR